MAALRGARLYADVQSTAPSAGPFIFEPVCLEPRKAFPLETLRSREREIQAGPRGSGFWVAHFQRTIHPEVNQNPGTIGLVNDPQVPILHVAAVHLDGVYPIEAVDAVQKEVESLEKV